MLKTPATLFRKNLDRELDREIERCVNNHEILRVKRRGAEDFIVISDTDWKAVEETIYLNQIPGLVESILQAKEESIKEGTPYRGTKVVNWKVVLSKAAVKD